LSLAVCAPGALGASQTAALGPVTATLSYEAAGFGQYKDVRLTIVRAGRPLLGQDLGTLCDLCAGAGPMAGGRAVHVGNLDGAGNTEPEVYADLWTGGIHCCALGVFYRLSDDGTRYEGLVHDFGNAPYTLTDIDRNGARELVTADNLFYERFTAYAASGAPVQILQYDHGTLHDLSHLFPARARSDARYWRRLITRQKHQRTGDLRGVVAPYVADQCLLGRCATGLRFATRLERAGYFSGRRAPGPWPRGARYVRALKRLLKRRGYD
jgi:hypothetical protein